MAPGATHSSSGDEAQDPLAGHRVVHVVGRLHAGVAEQLALMTAVLSSRGVPQTVVLFDDRQGRATWPRFHPAVRTVLAGGSRWRMPGALLQALHGEVTRERVAAVHAHGLLPCLVGILAARFLDLPAPLHVTFHRQRTRHLLERTVTMLWRTVAPPPAVALQDAPLPTEWAQPDVSDVFFAPARCEARRPLVVTASNEPDARHAARFVQLAVLLQSSGLAFNWLGPADGTAAAQFAAAGVGHYDARVDIERAARLCQAWLYVDCGGSTAASSQRLAEAMATGLPCVAWNAAAQDTLLAHERSGLLCDSEEGLLGCIAALVDSAELRARLGDAAREEALTRFSRAGRSEALIESYRTAAAQRDASGDAAPEPSQPLPRLGRATTATDQRCASTPAGDPG
ncbi:MAG TPA: glycosyltransferase [Burkholderiaceae bacterium]|nr:glycosyltransferase [Burkholderiaceae bacterium]